jgi:hypothetical protein
MPADPREICRFCDPVQVPGQIHRDNLKFNRGLKGAESMGIGKWLLISALAIGAAYQLWQTHERTVAERSLLPFEDTNGFVPVQTPSGSAADTVVILAALNCPSAAAKRADTMASRLTELGIPNARANNYSVSISDRAQLPLLQRTSVVLGGEIPVVIINGMAKANPTVDEVAAEFRRGK